MYALPAVPTLSRGTISMESQPVARGESIAAFIPDLEFLIPEAMDEWKIPGLAITVVQDGGVALVKAYGLRDVEAGLKATTDTQFPIGSITKSFTSTGLATPSRPTASRCAICSAIIPGCRATTGYGCPAICHPRKCWRQWVI